MTPPVGMPVRRRVVRGALLGAGTALIVTFVLIFGPAMVQGEDASEAVDALVFLTSPLVVGGAFTGAVVGRERARRYP